MAHLGIWSRKDPWAPGVLEPLISGLEQKGFCFATLREHPLYKHWIAQRGPVRVEQAGEQPQTSSVSGAKRVGRARQLA
jgi:hypothetical protein